jgi:unsaturated rhamnogalacturonyl hydrolase
MRMNFIGRLALVAALCAGCATHGGPKKYSGATPLEWSVRLADSEMARRGDSLTYKPEGREKWDYAAGLFALSLLKLAEPTHDNRYVDFSKQAIGSFISADGTIQTYKADEYQLDSLNGGKTVIALWQISGEDRYKKAATILQAQLDTQPRMGDGGFWHKQRYPHQMWLDGIYMGAPFYAQYTELFTEPGPTADKAFDDVARQIQLIDEHAFDAKTGLYFHGWDESKSQPWANPVTGCSSNFWGRAMGWYAMALVDVLDYLPTNHPAHPQLVATLQKVCAGIAKYQDPKTGLWWQVMDQGDRKGNYLEATASGMFVYALAKGVSQGYLPSEYRLVAEKGYAGMINHLIQQDNSGRWSLTQCCAVAGLGGSPSNGKMRDGSFDYYVSEPITKNDLKGVGPFILAGIELEKRARTKIQ